MGLPGISEFEVWRTDAELIRKTAEEFAGEAFAQSILLCPIGDRYHFLSGCTYIIQTGFYQRGGLV